MTDITLGGREITFDLEKISIREYRQFAQGSMLTDADDALLARVTGLTPDEIGDLSQPAYRRLLQAFFEKCREPLANPN